MANRDNTGRFLPGHNLGGPGRPKKADEERLLEIIDEVVDEDRFRIGIEKLWSMVESHGSTRAFQILMDRRYGKPQIRVEQRANGYDRLQELINNLPADDADNEEGDDENDGEGVRLLE